MFKELNKIDERPELFSKYTASELWTEEYVSCKMLEMHLNEDVDPASRNKAFMEKSFEWLIHRFEIKKGKKIIDFGCGPGFYTTRFAEEGADVTGVDFSQRSINYAKGIAEEKTLDINYVCQDYLTYETSRKVDLITMIYCDLCPLSTSQRQKMFHSFVNILNEDGLIVFDVFSLAFFSALEEMSQYDVIPGNGFWSAEKHHVFQNRYLYRDDKVMLDKYVIYEENLKREIYNWLQCFSLETITVELNRNGLEVVEVYSDVSGTTYSDKTNEIAVIAKKVKE